MGDAGLSAFSSRTLELVYRAPGFEQLWEGLLGGTARISTVIEAQPPGVRAAIRAAFARRVERHTVADRAVELLARVRLAAAAKPS